MARKYHQRNGGENIMAKSSEENDVTMANNMKSSACAAMAAAW